MSARVLSEPWPTRPFPEVSRPSAPMLRSSLLATPLGPCQQCSPTPTCSKYSAVVSRLGLFRPAALLPSGWEVEIIRSEPFTDGTVSWVTTLPRLSRICVPTTSRTRMRRIRAVRRNLDPGSRCYRKDVLRVDETHLPAPPATAEAKEELLRFAIEGRKRVKDRILRIDHTMDAVSFGYRDVAGTWHEVATQEELDFPHPYNLRLARATPRQY
jgi:hypothetical protein